MEGKKSGLSSHFGTIIRVVLLIILVGLVTFFIIKFIRDRQDSRRAEQTAGQVAQKENTDKSEEGKKDSGSNNNSESNQVIPSGVEESDDAQNSSSNLGAATVPAVGMNTNIIIGAIILSIFTYAVTRRLSTQS